MKVCQLGLLVAAALFASHVWAANGRPSNETLNEMGVGNLQVMSDAEGLNVRGMGWTGSSAGGASFAAVSAYGGNAASFNYYSASGKHKAAGQNNSYAGVEVKKSGGGHGGSGGGHGSYGSSGGQGSSGGHGSNGGHGGKPQSVKITAFSGGSSGGFNK
jgi:hypothetical protein